MNTSAPVVLTAKSDGSLPTLGRVAEKAPVAGLKNVTLLPPKLAT